METNVYDERSYFTWNCAFRVPKKKAPEFTLPRCMYATSCCCSCSRKYFSKLYPPKRIWWCIYIKFLRVRMLLLLLLLLFLCIVYAKWACFITIYTELCIAREVNGEQMPKFAKITENLLVVIGWKSRVLYTKQ